ncbi:MAG TPA: DUF1592 domain-containing protein [Tepidisphaeraceae bacterium]
MGSVRPQLALLSTLLFVPFILCAQPADNSPPAPPAQTPAIQAAPSLQIYSYQGQILPYLTKHCFACHGNGKSKADLSFDQFKDDLSVYSDRKTWDSVQHMLETHEMPPAKRPQPKEDETDSTLTAIRGVFDRFDRTAKPNPGRVTMRRLNKTEYNNTIRDLVGIDFKPADDFPADDVGYGFDNIGDVLSVTPLLLEKYLSAAEQVLEQGIVILDPPKPTRSQIGAIRLNATATKSELGGTISFDEGDYIIRARVSGDQIGDEPVRAMIRVAGKDLKEFEVPNPKGRSMTIQARLRMKPGTARVGVAFLNPFKLPAPTTLPTTEPALAATQPATKPALNANGQPRRFGQQPPVSDGRTRILFLQGIEVEGPFDPPPPELPEAHKRLMAHDPGLAPRDAATQIITRFASKAYRRPVRPQEVDACLRIYDAATSKGNRFELCMRAALYRVMVSPNFLFRVELDPPGAKEGETYAINEYELASRLSYFLWNSTPDDELMSLASKGELRTHLDAQLHRMVQDPKSVSFLYGFAEQWLALRKLEISSPDPKQFPSFDDNLRNAMIRESDLFFEAIVREDRRILDLLDADFTFVNGQLAKHYGIDGVKGKKFVRVKAPLNRGGILTQASVLTLTSNATRTSPVKRGKFILEQILNTPPPPPPPDVPALDEQKQLTGTLRQVMEQHRANALCASCHQRMDPIGFAFENFDAIGVWRDKDGQASIDASGTLPDGKTFNGPDGLKQLLKAKKTLFVRCVAEKMLTYATGRGLEYYDRRAVDKIMSELARNDYRFSTLLTEIVKSDPFQMRTATGESQ